MKIKTTQKAVKESHIKVIKIGYCGLQNLLTFEDPIAYTCGREGWKADIYSIGTTAIVTGYAPFGNKVSYDLYSGYDIKAAEVLANVKLPYEDRKAKVTALLHEFIEAVTDR